MAVMLSVPEASALPLFTRQTGMPCSGCHFQHFPMLNSFGRSFKAAGFTMMGAQGTVEGDGLSIPNALNMTALTTLGYEKSNMATATLSGMPVGTKNTGDGTLYVPGTNGELSLFFGGRVNENAGFLAELGMEGGAALGSAKMPILYEVANGVRAGIVPFTTESQGASYGFELLNTGANAVHQMSPVSGFTDAHSKAISAQQYIGTEDFATGLSFVMNSPMGFINVTKFQQMGPADMGGQGAGLSSTYGRVAATLDVAGWDTGFGIQGWSGSSYSLDSDLLGVSGVASTKASAMDAQMQGELGGKPVGFYASYARAPVVTMNASTLGNVYNHNGTMPRSSLNISAEVGLIPEKATLGAAIRRAKSGVEIVPGTNATDNAVMVTATYKVSQNMLASLSHTSASGGYWNQVNVDAMGSKTTTINLFTLF